MAAWVWMTLVALGLHGPIIRLSLSLTLSLSLSDLGNLDLFTFLPFVQMITEDLTTTELAANWLMKYPLVLVSVVLFNPSHIKKESQTWVCLQTGYHKQVELLKA